MIKTIGELKQMIKDLPDDMVVVGYDGGDSYPDAKYVSFYVVDRTENEDWEEWKKDKEMTDWWKDREVPDKVFVCSTD